MARPQKVSRNICNQKSTQPQISGDRWIITSDLHFGLTRSVIYHTGEHEGVEYPYLNLKLCAELANKYNTKGILVLGDVFDRKTNNHKLLDKVHGLFSEILELLGRDKLLVMISGNHDIMEFHGQNLSTDSKPMVYTSLNLLSSCGPNIHIVHREVEADLIPNTVLVPYVHRSLLLENVDLWAGMNILTHVGVSGFSIRKDFVMYNDEFKPENFKYYGRVFTGHYHMAQEKDNITMVGSPWPVRKDELEDKKHIYLWDVETNNVEKFPTIVPQVVSYNLESTTTQEPKKRMTYKQHLDTIVSKYIEPNPYVKIRIRVAPKNGYAQTIGTRLLYELPSNIILEYTWVEDNNNTSTTIDNTQQYGNNNNIMDSVVITVEKLVEDYPVFKDPSLIPLLEKYRVIEELFVVGDSDNNGL